MFRVYNSRSVNQLKIIICKYVQCWDISQMDISWTEKHFYFNDNSWFWSCKKCPIYEISCVKMSSVICSFNKKVFLLNIPTREGCGLLIKTGVYIFLNNHFHPPRPSEYDPLFPLDVKHVCAENIFLLLRFEIIFSAK